MSEKPPFDPTQPFETTAAIKPEFDPSQPFESAPKADPITLNKIVRSAATGVPILGGLMNKANAATNAALAPIIEPFLTKGPDTLDQPTFGERYAKSLELQDKQDEKFGTEHPIVDTAAQLAGGVGATLPLAAGTLGPMAARAMGMGGTNLIGQTLRSVASGAGINAADALVRGNDVGTSAGIGAAVGAAAPTVGRVIGGATEGLRNAVRGIVNPAEETARRAGKALLYDLRAGQGGLSPSEFNAAVAAGEPVINMDLGGGMTRALARDAANTSPEGLETLNRSIDPRFSGQADRLSSTFNKTLHFPTEAERNKAIRDVAEKVYEPAYDKAHQEAANKHLWFVAGTQGKGGYPKVDPDLASMVQAPVVQDAIRIATVELRNRAILDGARNAPVGPFSIVDGKTVPNETAKSITTPTLQFWDYVKRALDKSGDGKASQYAKMIRGKMDSLVPSYETARAAAAPTKFFDGARNAYEAGQNFVGKMENFGPAAQDALSNMTEAERKLFSDGYAQKIIEKVERTNDRRNVIDRFHANKSARVELEMAMGDTRARQIEARLYLEGIMDKARPAVQGNSTTVRQLAHLGIAGGAGLASGGNPADPATWLSAAMAYGTLRGRNFINERVARQVGELLASNNPARVAQGMRIASQTKFLDALRRTDAALSKAGSVQAEPHPSGP